MGRRHIPFAKASPFAKATADRTADLSEDSSQTVAAMNGRFQKRSSAV